MKYNCKNSADFMNGIVSNGRNLSAVVTHNGVTVPLAKVKDFNIQTSQDDIKIFGSAYSQQLTINFFNLDGTFNIVTGDTINVGIISNNIVSAYPTFYVTSVEIDKTTQVMRVLGYDVMLLGNNKVFHPSEGVTYTLGSLASQCATGIGASGVVNFYNGSNISSLTWAADDLNIDANGISYRDLIRSIAEVTGSIAYINSTNKLVFRQFGYNPTAQAQEDANIDTSTYLVDKSQIFGYDIDIAQVRQLGGVVNSNELQDNTQYPQTSIPDDKLLQIIYCNPLLSKRNPSFISPILENIYNTLHSITFQPYSLEWRGNSIMEMGDLFCIEGQTNQYFPYISEKTVFNGGIKTSSEWKCDNNGSRDVNLGGSNIGTSNRTTRAVVDKANGEIELLVAQIDGPEGIGARLAVTENEISTIVGEWGPQGTHTKISQTDEEVTSIAQTIGPTGTFWSRIEQDAQGIATTVVEEALGPSGSAWSQITQTATQVASTVSTNKIDEALGPTGAIGSELADLQDQIDDIDVSGIESDITQIQSDITQQANQIALVVTATGPTGAVVNSASIVTAINNSGSNVKIDADKIDISGQVTFLQPGDDISELTNDAGYVGSSALSNYPTKTDLATANTTTINGGNITTGTISADRIDTTNLYVQNIGSTGWTPGVGQAVNVAGNMYFRDDYSGNLISWEVDGGANVIRNLGYSGYVPNGIVIGRQNPTSAVFGASDYDAKLGATYFNSGIWLDGSTYGSSFPPGSQSEGRLFFKLSS